MQFYPQRKKGFIFNEDVAEELGILNEYQMYQEDYDYDPLIEAFNQKFGVEPEYPKHFKWEKGGYVQGLQGFDWDTEYLLFDTYVEQQYPDEWDKFINSLEEMDIDLIEGSWSELG